MKKLVYSWPWVRIDKRLSQELPYSRSFFSHLFERWAIKSNERVLKKSYKLKDGDEVLIDNLERFIDGGILEECPARDLDIRLEKKDYMVIYKPKWVLSHPNSVRDVTHPSVVWGLYRYMKTREGDGVMPSSGNFIRAGLIHRLDKDTDGLMLVAKTESWLAYFKELFQQKSQCETIEKKERVSLKKYYTATSVLTPKGEDFLVQIQNNTPYYIQEDVLPKVPHAIIKFGITKILTFEKKDDQVTLSLEILTGRTHQIRYHLSKYGLPIVWDYLYGTESETPMQLTASTLEFIDIDGKAIKLTV